MQQRSLCMLSLLYIDVWVGRSHLGAWGFLDISLCTMHIYTTRSTSKGEGTVFFWTFPQIKETKRHVMPR
jgi:hypothetical protein